MISRFLHSNSPNVVELLEVLGLKDKLVMSVQFSLSYGETATVEVTYGYLDRSEVTRDVVEGRHTLTDVSKLAQFLKRYELHEIP